MIFKNLIKYTQNYLIQTNKNIKRSFSTKIKPHLKLQIQQSIYIQNKLNQMKDPDQILQFLKQQDLEKIKVKQKIWVNLLKQFTNHQDLTQFISIQSSENSDKDDQILNNYLIQNSLIQQDIDLFNQIYYQRTRNKFTYLTIIQYYLEQNDFERCLEYYIIMKKYHGDDIRITCQILKNLTHNDQTKWLFNYALQNLDQCKQTQAQQILNYCIHNYLPEISIIVKFMIDKQYIRKNCLNNLIKYICQTNDMDLLHLIQDLLDFSKFDSNSFDNLIKAFVQNDKRSETLEIYEKMKLFENSHSIYTFNTLIQYFCQINDLDQSQKILDEMQQYNIKPDIQIYNHFLNNYRNYQEKTKANKLFKTIQEQQLKPNQISLNALIHLFIGDQNYFEYYLSQFKEYNIDQNIHSINARILHLQKIDRNSDIKGIINQMNQLQIQPNNITISLVIDSLGFQKDLNSLIELIKQSNFQDLSFDENNFNSVLEAFYKCKRQDLMIIQFKHMIEILKKLENPLKTFKIMDYSLKDLPQEQEKIRIFFDKEYPQIFQNKKIK